MRLRKAADRTVSILGLGLFGVLTGFSLFLTSRFALSYEEIPRTTGDIFPLVLLICGCLTFVMYRISEWMLREEERQEQRVRILAGAVFCYALLLGGSAPPMWFRQGIRRPSVRLRSSFETGTSRCSPSIPMRNIFISILIR